VAAADKVTNLANEVAAASDEQSKGIEQINVAVTQMNAVTQQNSANAEEAASASEEAAGQAENLQASVAELTAIVNGSAKHSARHMHHATASVRPDQRRASGGSKPRVSPVVTRQQPIPLDAQEEQLVRF
jgi:hypothetical protein